MAEYEKNKIGSEDWYTPKALLKAIGESYDLDPCSPGVNHWVPATKIYTKCDDGLLNHWHGFVFMNPPFGTKRHAVVPWIEKFIHHGNGIGLCRAYTSSWWFQSFMPQMDLLLFPNGKTKFVRPDGKIGGSPGHGIALFAIGKRGVDALVNSKLGLCYKLV